MRTESSREKMLSMKIVMRSARCAIYEQESLIRIGSLGSLGYESEIDSYETCGHALHNRKHAVRQTWPYQPHVYFRKVKKLVLCDTHNITLKM